MILLILGSLFYSLLYSLIGSLFFSFFYSESFKLFVNGNGGFVGKYLETTFLINLININSQFFYFLFIFIISVLFLISIQFKVNSFYLFTKKFFNFLFTSSKKNYTKENEVINEFIPQDQIKDLIQEDLPFIKNEAQQDSKKTKFDLPPVNLLKIPSNKDKNKLNEDDFIDSGFLEKILLDFGVNGNIKKVSHGPVVTLNEFEPAAGVKVSKIINLSR